MHRTLVILTNKQLALLKSIKRETGAPFSAVIRIALNKHLGIEEDCEDEDSESVQN